MTREPHLRPSPLALSLATSSATALVLAVVCGRPELIAFAAPLLGALASGYCRTDDRMARLAVRADRSSRRCFENERVRIRVSTGGPDEGLTLRPVLPAGLELESGGNREWIIRAGRWGRYTVPVRVSTRDPSGLLICSTVTEVVEVRVYPRPAPLREAVRPADPTERLGVHSGRKRGGGVEFAGIRPYLPGDPLGAVNWRVTARRGRLQVTERLAERATDVVALIDTYLADRSGLDLAVRGAAEVTQAALRRGDRAGVLALGGTTRWLRPDMGRRQFYRIVDAVLDVAPADPAAGPDGAVPRAALAPRAYVIAFSPLRDDRAGVALQQIRGRGHPVVVIDVHREPERDDTLADRLRRLGIPVLAWPAESTLDEVLLPVTRRRLPAGRPRP